jgi:hypothetical protein
MVYHIFLRRYGDLGNLGPVLKSLTSDFIYATITTFFSINEMGLQAIRDFQSYFQPETLEHKVATCFLKQPTQIGQHAGQLRSINFSNSDDRAIFINAVNSDFQKITMHFKDREKANCILANLKSLLLE